MKMKKTLALVLAGAMTLSMTACGKEYKSLLDDFFESIEEADGELYMDIVHPIILENERESYDLTKSEQEEMYQEFIDIFHDTLEEEYGDDFKFSYKIKDDTKLDDDELDDWADELETLWGEKVDVTNGYEAEVELTFKADGNKDTETAEFVFLEVEDEWCIVESDL